MRFGYGANANPKDHAAFEARFGFPLIEAWAMTETGGGALVAASREPRHVGTRCIGFPRDDLNVQIAESGELLVRRAGADPRRGFFSGYLKDDKATEEAWRDGWFHTGDAVRRGPDGALHFVDRLKNIIRRAGENIAALEVEAALAGHPAIAQVAVIAVPDSVRDEEVMACVVLQYGTRRGSGNCHFYPGLVPGAPLLLQGARPRRVPRFAADHRDQQGTESQARRFRRQCGRFLRPA